MTQPFDFRKPPPGELDRQTAGWLNEACYRATVAWAKQIPYSAELQSKGVASVTAGDGLNALPADAIGFPVKAASIIDDSFLIAISRPLVIALLSGLMGEKVASLPSDRSLTSLENSLCSYMIRELFLAPLESAWPLPDPVKLSVTTVGGGAPRTLWRVAAADPSLLATLHVLTQFGEHPCYLLLPRSQLWTRLADPPPAKASPHKAVEREHIESLVHEMAVEVGVTLGTAEMSLFDLARLQAGDLLILKQKVSEPLQASVGGSPKFRVWPGAVGSHQAVQVHAANA
jgi:flagellar motor switch protein FliM